MKIAWPGVMRVSVCIFARNEERLLPGCVGALDAAAGGLGLQTHILVNGSTDETMLVARTLAAADARISVHELPVGDKANAWNDYVFRIADETADAHIFIDGDVKPSRGAIAALAMALRGAPRAYGAAALPATGRSRRQWAMRLFLNHYLSGNLYALSKQALKEFRRRDLRLPFGAKGEDGIISYLLLTDFEGGADDSHKDRIAVVGNATFEFESLGPKMRDFKIYSRRLSRYSERHFQKQILYARLKEDGANAMPDDVADIYTPEILSEMRPRLDPVNYWFDRATLKRLAGGKNRFSSEYSTAR